jgi:hypothetical protein
MYLRQIDSIHPKTHAITVLIPAGNVTHLPDYILAPSHTETLPSASEGYDANQLLRQATVTSPTQLEQAVLDVGGRLEGLKRGANAWKNFTVWRQNENVGVISQEGMRRGGRENHGTLYYLRSSSLQHR